MPEGLNSQLSGLNEMRLCFDDMQNTLISTGREGVDRSGSYTSVFFIVLFATKPLVDLMWNFRLFAVGGVALNLLAIVGFCVFITAGYLYFFQYDERRIFNKRLIWSFLGLNLFTSCISVFFYDLPIMYAMDFLIKLFAAYFIYFIGHRCMENNKGKLRIIGTIWITTALITVLSIIRYFQGGYDIDVSQGVERFAGLYNDPGTPSYIAVISLVYGTLYIEILRKQEQPVPLIVRIAFVLMLLVVVFTLKITLTKSALLMFIVFLAMWFVLYKRKTYIIVPLIILGTFYIYTKSEAIQARLAPELEFLTADKLSMEQARHIGEGRIALWERLLIYYSQDYDLFQKLFGSSRSFGAHNQYIDYLMQIGLVGLTVFLVILLRFYRQLILLYREYCQPDIYMAMVLLTLFVIAGLTGHPFGYTTLLWYLMIMLSLINTHNCDHNSNTFIPRSGSYVVVDSIEPGGYCPNLGQIIR